MSRLDLPKAEEVNYSTEDKIFALLFVEKGLTKSEISRKLNVSYETIFNETKGMETKGYLVCREERIGRIYYLTSEGCREAEYRLNNFTYLDIYEYLIGLNYPILTISNFLKAYFYKYYLEGVCDTNNIAEQYLEWCEKNNIEPIENLQLKKYIK